LVVVGLVVGFSGRFYKYIVVRKWLKKSIWIPDAVEAIFPRWVHLHIESRYRLKRPSTKL
jgi:hypothetical protein